MHRFALFGFVTLLAITPAWAADTDGDSIDDSNDLCPNVFGVAAAQGCPQFSPYDGKRFDDAAQHVTDNACLLDLVTRHGALLASFSTGPFCPMYRLTFSAPVRRCDILFPAVIDPITGEILSRGPAVLTE